MGGHGPPSPRLPGVAHPGELGGGGSALPTLSATRAARPSPSPAGIAVFFLRMRNRGQGILHTNREDASGARAALSSPCSGGTAAPAAPCAGPGRLRLWAPRPARHLLEVPNTPCPQRHPGHGTAPSASGLSRDPRLGGVSWGLTKALGQGPGGQRGHHPIQVLREPQLLVTTGDRELLAVLVHSVHGRLAHRHLLQPLFGRRRDVVPAVACKGTWVSEAPGTQEHVPPLQLTGVGLSPSPDPPDHTRVLGPGVSCPRPADSPAAAVAGPRQRPARAEGTWRGPALHVVDSQPLGRGAKPLPEPVRLRGGQRGTGHHLPAPDAVWMSSQEQASLVCAPEGGQCGQREVGLCRATLGRAGCAKCPKAPPPASLVGGQGP